jgi:hypothetical protein
MKRSILIILLVSFLVPVVEAQTSANFWKLKRFEAVGGIGPSFFFGDIGGYSQSKNVLGLKDISILQTRFDINANLKYRIFQNLNVRLSLTYALLHATDERGSNEGRLFESSISIFEPAILGEFYFIKNRSENSYLFTKGRGLGIGGFIRTLDFYVFSGIGGLQYSSKGNARLVNYGIRPGGFTAVIPAGLGSTLVYSPDLNFGVEIGGRYSFSDFLDGYSNIQYSRSNDVYYFFNFTVTYKMKNGPKGWPSFR